MFSFTFYRGEYLSRLQTIRGLWVHAEIIRTLRLKRPGTLQKWVQAYLALLRFTLLRSTNVALFANWRQDPSPAKRWLLALLILDLLRLSTTKPTIFPRYVESKFQEEKNHYLKQVFILKGRGKFRLIQMFSTWRKNTKKTFVNISVY